MPLTPTFRFARVRGPLDARYIMPAYGTDGAAGMDLRADTDSVGPWVLLPGERRCIPTGWAIELPLGFEAQIRPRSGLALDHGVTVLNAPGTIDSDYRGEVQVLLINFGTAQYSVHAGERIAQLVVAPVARALPVLSAFADLTKTTRGDGGFGSTGA